MNSEILVLSYYLPQSRIQNQVLSVSFQGWSIGNIAEDFITSKKIMTAKEVFIDCESFADMTAGDSAGSNLNETHTIKGLYHHIVDLKKKTA